jgi:hypothetical protein
MKFRHEIPAQYGRWGTPSVGAWNSGVNELKDFLNHVLVISAMKLKIILI